MVYLVGLECQVILVSLVILVVAVIVAYQAIPVQQAHKARLDLKDHKEQLH